MHWYDIENIDQIDTPSLILYKERIAYNITQALKLVKDPSLLRPHVKTNKIAEVCRMMMDAGITKFKCATIAEAEMLAMIEAKDVLLAYQPVGPKAERLSRLAIHYPDTNFSCNVDSFQVAANLSQVFSRSGLLINVFIDLNTGMNRTGVSIGDAYTLFTQLTQLPSVHVSGIHAYDGHLQSPDPERRKKDSDTIFDQVMMLVSRIESTLGRKITVVAGGSPTFPAHAMRNVECSPGTFVFWDWGYKHRFPEEPFEYAALVITRVISIVSNNLITVDLGYKSVASESPLPRVYFINAPGSVPLHHSEEHMVVQVPDASKFQTGDVLFGIPVHICPTVALYDRAILVENKQATTVWKVAARDRVINF
jgi:D-serine deaminase-like pyridoxal phosphate-dependent protein